MARDRPARRADDRARRGRRRCSTRRALDGAHYAGFLASRPGRRGRRDRPGHRAGRGDRRPRPRRAPEQRRRRARAARRPRGRRRRERRDLPALPDLRRRAHRRRRHRAQVLPADPRGRQPRGAVGGAGRRRHRLRRLRPLAVHGRPQAAAAAATSAWPGAASPRSSSACPRCGPAPGRAATRWSTWCAGWPPRRPTGSGSRHKGRIEVGADADLVRFAPDEEFIVDVAAAAPPQPGVGVRRPPARRRGPRDLAARRTGRADDATAGTTAEERTSDDLLRAEGRAAAADRAHHRPGACSPRRTP